MEAIDDHADLRGHGVVVEGRDKDHHVRLLEFGVQALHVVLEDTGVGATLTGVTANAGVHFLEGCVKAKDGIVGSCGTINELVREQGSGALFVRAAGENYDMHGNSSFYIWQGEARPDFARGFTRRAPAGYAGKWHCDFEVMADAHAQIPFCRRIL